MSRTLKGWVSFAASCKYPFVMQLSLNDSFTLILVSSERADDWLVKHLVLLHLAACLDVSR